MLDVHPPEHAAHTWRDFFIHIATIVLGLLIAVGLEQAVLALEHRHEVAETRERLRLEREANIRIFHRDVSYMRDIVGALRGDLRVLQYLKAHPGSSRSQLPGVLYWIPSSSPPETSAWDWAEKAPVLELLPQEEVQRDRSMYVMLKDSGAKYMQLTNCMTEAGDYRFVQPDVSKLTAQQIDTALQRTQACLLTVFQYAVSLNNVVEFAPDFEPGPSNAELNAFEPDAVALAANPHTFALYQDDLKAAHVWDDYDAAMSAFTKGISADGAVDVRQIYEGVVAAHPRFKPDEDTLNDLGYAQMERGRLPQALGVFQLVVRLHPDSWNAYDSLGEAYRKAGDKQQAIANYKRSLQLNPSNDNARKALAELGK